jgi:flagellar motor protein MotB
MGETRPLFGEDAGADRKKNNRLELVLTPKAE